MRGGKRKAEDSAVGCRALAQADRARAAAVSSEPMRGSLKTVLMLGQHEPDCSIDWKRTSPGARRRHEFGTRGA
jgi:hypothetical protein